MVEIIPKVETGEPLWRSIGAVIVLAFVLVMLSFFAVWYLQGTVREAISNVEQKLQASSSLEELSLEQEVFAYGTKIRNLQSLVSQRQDVLKFLGFLEENTHSQVVFTNFSFSPKTNSMVLQGKAQDFGVVEEQLAILKGKESMVQTLLSSLGVGKEKQVIFQIELTFSNL